jgi:HPt (histidine-containing phosphotransfer) domain-containing protein
MNDHIAKPIDPDQLATTLRRWLRQSVAVHASPASARNRAPPPDAEAIEGPTGFDMPRALRNLAGDRELFTQMLEVFIEDHADKGDAARAAAAASDWRRVNGIAHTLKGAAGTMGASSLARVAAELEASTRDDLVSSGRDDSARGVEALALALESVVTNIKAHQKARETSTATRETVLA